MFPLTARQFSATFLDFQRNSRGYNDKVESADQDVTRRLLNPLFSDFEVFSVSQCHHFGKAMWAFARECTAAQRQSTNRNTDLTFPPCHFISEGDSQFPFCHFISEGDSQFTPSRVDELPRSSELLHSASKNEASPTSCNIPEQNEQPNVGILCTGPLKSDFTDTVTWNGASKIRTTSNESDQNQNTVISEFSISQNSASSSCKEIHYDAHVSNKLTTSEALSNRSSSHFENDDELATCNLEPRITLSTDCHPQNGYEKRVDIHGASGSNHSDLFSDDERYMRKAKNVKAEESVVSMLENKDVTKDHGMCVAAIGEKQNTLMLNKSLYSDSHIIPLPLYKKGNHSNIPISKSLTVNLNLDALLSVLHSEKKTVKYAEHDCSIYGKVAILYGFQQNTTVSVLQAEMVGWYNYISGTVNGLQQSLCHDNSGTQDIKSPFSSSLVGFDLDAFLTHFHHMSRALTPQAASGGNHLKEHSAVAWLLTSPALGVTLDWQVQEKFHKFLEILSTGEHSAQQQQSTVSNNDCLSTQWFNLLVNIDEYRFAEKDIPLVEVYELSTSRDINIVNFDLN